MGIVVGAVVFAIGAFVLFQPDDEQPTTAPERGPAPRETETDRPATAPQPKAGRLELRGGETVGGLRKITVRKGEVVRFSASSDVADEVHLHGYDIARPVGPGRDARFRFRATTEGVFDFELENRGAEIAVLEVRP